ncbi:hypothetical protein JTB14_017041 [Gonioctena quinquepunctata]|nr:hypothetical protein JTB14_017041 [Gonioctena quinquepunctata]
MSGSVVNSLDSHQQRPDVQNNPQPLLNDIHSNIPNVQYPYFQQIHNPGHQFMSFPWSAIGPESSNLRTENIQSAPLPTHNIMMEIYKCQKYLPSFGATEGEFEREFIDNLERALTDMNIPVEYRTRLAKKCLLGDAQKWCSMFVSDNSTFEDFMALILDEFWGETAQRFVRYEMDNGFHEKQGDSKMAA